MKNKMMRYFAVIIQDFEIITGQKENAEVGLCGKQAWVIPHDYVKKKKKKTVYQVELYMSSYKGSLVGRYTYSFVLIKDEKPSI